ncbi:MAG: trypsin-like peptidase domain-containing protein [Candidatus Sungbacteria bacterium]|nr:trypsin-like peptidase domain-containing protein [Candidatus Sungbacteria bacterium]
MTHEEQVIRTVQKAMPAVVSVVVAKDLSSLEAQGFPFFGMPEELFEESEDEIIDRLPKTDDGKIRIGGGSGFVVDSSGIVLTNKHVVTDKDAEYTVVTQDEKKYSARVVARDPINDVAILKVEAKDMPILELGDSNNIILGQTVIAVGNALGEFKNTVSTGIVSGLSRLISAVTDMKGNVERLRGLIQTDAAINPGNSGGPLVNLRGEVIGINSAVVFGAQNIGFAIPINKAKEDLEDVKKYGHIRKPFLGVRYLMLNKAIQRKLNLITDHGCLVLREKHGHGIVKGSAADLAGIREGDVIIEAAGTKLDEKTTLEDILDKMKIGDALQMKIWRAGKEFEAEVKLGERS